MGQDNAELRLANDRLQSKLDACRSLFIDILDEALLPNMTHMLNLFFHNSKTSSEDFTVDDETLLREMSIYVSFMKQDITLFKNPKYTYFTIKRPGDDELFSADLVNVMLQLLFEHVRFSSWFVKTPDLPIDMRDYEAPPLWSKLWSDVVEYFPFDYKDSPYEQIEHGSRDKDLKCNW